VIPDSIAIWCGLIGLALVIRGLEQRRALRAPLNGAGRPVVQYRAPQRAVACRRWAAGGSRAGWRR